uniref:Uncharacterized protein n=1 Tax=Eutreptiella gymnastica TaxID=73025 RepID=A0A7S1I6W7_9EUGL
MDGLKSRPSFRQCATILLQLCLAHCCERCWTLEPQLAHRILRPFLPAVITGLVHPSYCSLLLLRSRTLEDRGTGRWPLINLIPAGPISRLPLALNLVVQGRLTSADLPTVPKGNFPHWGRPFDDPLTWKAPLPPDPLGTNQRS